ncbi:MAG: outer membrane beta-barrel protein [Salinivirgaceae bacterium]|nr:outer membrane beta-barrel protein [Salinivirgaceae bacterium]
MKHLIFLGFLLLMLTHVQSQQIYLDLGKTFSQFDYKNTEGEKLEGLLGSNQNNLGLGYRISILKTGWHVLGGVSYQKYGAKGSDQSLGNYYEWDATLLGANAGIDYEFFKPEFNYSERYRFTLYLRGMAATEFLMQGTQIMNSQIYDLKKKEEFDQPFLFLRGSIGAKYYLSKVLSVYAQYMGGKSFLFFGNYSNKEQLRITTHSFNIGISICLTNKGG